MLVKHKVLFINNVSGQRGGGGGWKMLTMADEGGGRGGKANADDG